MINCYNKGGVRMTTQIIAHRGASAYAPENTMDAFRKALDMHADGIETDVHLTKDHVPVLMHDERINRTSNEAGFIHHYTLDELQQLDIGSWFSSAFSGARIVTLEEFLSWIRETEMVAHIELKNNKIDYPNIESIVYNYINDYSMHQQTIVSSFNFDSVMRFKEIANNVEVAFLTSKMNSKTREMLKENPVHALHIKHTLLNKKMIHYSQANQMPIRVFTINKRPAMVRCFHVGVHGIFTDVPDLAYETRANMDESSRSE